MDLWQEVYNAVVTAAGAAAVTDSVGATGTFRRAEGGAEAVIVDRDTGACMRAHSDIYLD